MFNSIGKGINGDGVHSKAGIVDSEKEQQRSQKDQVSIMGEGSFKNGWAKKQELRRKEEEYASWGE